MSSDRGPGSSSSGDPVVVATGVTKQYRLGERQQYQTLRDVMAGAFRLGRGSGDVERPGVGGAGQRTLIRAVDDVSFTVGDGEVVGIIGRNGAGKSTLLKILSRITTPTEGEIRMRGRIGSLLEVGSGFHPELTGTENVFLNGAILGMSRHEIRAKLDEIVEFAEMGDFMTTPVKHYSVGMFMRLAFAVAAHLDAEILVVDEVLAVGDARFQQKCLAKMGQVARSGRSVLFVSHNLEATLALCDRGLVLERGRLIHDGETRGAVEAYRGLAGVTTRIGDRIDLSDLPREGTGEARFAQVRVSSTTGSGRDGSTAGGRPGDDETTIRSGGSLVLDVEVDAPAPLDIPSVGLTLGTEGGLLLLNLDSADAAGQEVGRGADRPGRGAGAGAPGAIRLGAGTTRLRLEIPTLQLAPGRYRVGLRLANPVTTRIGSGAVDLLDPALVLEVGPGVTAPPDRAGTLDPTTGDRDGAEVVVTQGAGSVVPGTLRLRTD